MESTLGDRCDRGIPAIGSRGLRRKRHPRLTPMSVDHEHISRGQTEKSLIQQRFTLLHKRSCDRILSISPDYKVVLSIGSARFILAAPSAR